MASFCRFVLLTVCIVPGCFAEPAPVGTACTPGTQISCDCGKADGIQVCMVSGHGYEPCECEGSDATGTVTSDSATSTTQSTQTSGEESTTSVDPDTGGVDTSMTSLDTSSANDETTTTDSGSTTGTMESEVVINELVYDPVSGEEDWIELYNRGKAPVDVSDWLISDGNNFFAIPQGTVLEPDAYLVYTRNEQDTFTWGFGDEEQVILLDARAQQVDSASWQLGQAIEPHSFGRLPNGTGSFMKLTPTKGAANE